MVHRNIRYAPNDYISVTHDCFIRLSDSISPEILSRKSSHHREEPSKKTRQLTQTNKYGSFVNHFSNSD